MKNPVVVGEKVYLRPLELDDLERCLKWINDPEVGEFLANRLPLNSLREEEWLKSLYRAHNEVNFAICLKDGDIHIGNVGLHRISWIDRFALLGIMIGEKDYWNKGYGTEAVKLILKYAFERLNLHKVELFVLSFNMRAIRCYEKAGFKHEGTLRKRRFKNGTYHDELIMGILRDEWKAT